MINTEFWQDEDGDGLWQVFRRKEHDVEVFGEDAVSFFGDNVAGNTKDTLSWHWRHNKCKQLGDAPKFWGKISGGPASL